MGFRNLLNLYLVSGNEVIAATFPQTSRVHKIARSAIIYEGVVNMWRSHLTSHFVFASGFVKKTIGLH